MSDLGPRRRGPPTPGEGRDHASPVPPRATLIRRSPGRHPSSGRFWPAIGRSQCSTPVCSSSVGPVGSVGSVGPAAAGFLRQRATGGPVHDEPGDARQRRVTRARPAVDGGPQQRADDGDGAEDDDAARCCSRRAASGPTRAARRRVRAARCRRARCWRPWRRRRRPGRAPISSDAVRPNWKSPNRMCPRDAEATSGTACTRSVPTS